MRSDRFRDDHHSAFYLVPNATISHSDSQQEHLLQQLHLQSSDKNNLRRRKGKADNSGLQKEGRGGWQLPSSRSTVQAG